MRNAGHPAFKTIADAQKKLSGEQDRLGRTKKQHTMLKKRIDKDNAQLKQLAGAGENLLRLTLVKEKAEQRLKDLSSLVEKTAGCAKRKRNIRS
ncbi:MAG: hypothetical protein K6F27_03125 [Ruminococcus sp.]|nr:hypothetical protein [Ruminococcus sp.]